MKILDKIDIENKEYICIQMLYIENRMVYKAYSEQEDKKVWIEQNSSKYKIITDRKILDKIENMTIPKTDIIIRMEETDE